jgi:hypothetical protein
MTATPLLEWLRKNSRTFNPTRDLALRAVRHLSKIERRKMYAADIEPMKTAEGRWYESIVYEMMIKVSQETDLITGVVRKGADARHQRDRYVLGQNGLFYSRVGDINIRGNGQDLAEFDFLLLDQDRKLIFGEVVTSAMDMKDFEEEIRYKKQLLGYLTGQRHVPFLLFSSVDISRISVVRRLLKDPDNVLLMTRSCEEIKRLVHPEDIRKVPRQPVHHAKLVSAPEIPLAHSFDYRRLHDDVRHNVLEALLAGKGVPDPATFPPAYRLVKKVIFGAMYPSGIRSFGSRCTTTIRGEVVDTAALERNFAKVVIAADLPGFEPIVYLRSAGKKEYLKMIRSPAGFRFERYTPSKVGFFLWLESLRPSLGGTITRTLLDALVQKTGEKNLVKR